ncbi:hypothetical protein THII_3573 [Thioploca ingrica]|uniref:Type I restriction enzyme R protein N-terminal domain-containing protein n=1 Tax=Thioploca ingrica TaxID=40754 RepID=A0A090AQH2_9GAMM|nr:hypothetical protein THII_3573 [Thioploca ingrica]
MAYGDFTLKDLLKRFQLHEKIIALFNELEPVELGSWLIQTLDLGLPLALSSSSEKARSELIVMPILLELRRRNHNTVAIYSGERLDVDADLGLKGECDFILAKSDLSHTIQAPIFLLVEAKKNDIGEGLGQCAAQMMGARVYNQTEGNNIDTIFGGITTGMDWQFLKLAGNTIFVDSQRYYLSEVGKILSVLQHIVDNQ